MPSNGDSPFEILDNGQLGQVIYDNTSDVNNIGTTHADAPPGSLLLHNSGDAFVSRAFGDWRKLFTDIRAYAIIVGHVDNEDTLDECDYVDQGSGVELVNALVESDYGWKPVFLKYGSPYVISDSSALIDLNGLYYINILGESMSIDAANRILIQVNGQITWDDVEVRLTNVEFRPNVESSDIPGFYPSSGSDVKFWLDNARIGVLGSAPFPPFLIDGNGGTIDLSIQAINSHITGNAFTKFGSNVHLVDSKFINTEINARDDIGTLTSATSITFDGCFLNNRNSSTEAMFKLNGGNDILFRNCYFYMADNTAPFISILTSGVSGFDLIDNRFNREHIPTGNTTANPLLAIDNVLTSGIRIINNRFDQDSANTGNSLEMEVSDGIIQGNVTSHPIAISGTSDNLNAIGNLTGATGLTYTGPGTNYVGGLNN